MIKDNRHLPSQNIEKNYCAKLIERFHNCFEKRCSLHLSFFIMISLVVMIDGRPFPWPCVNFSKK